MGTNLVMPNTYLNLSTGPVLSRPSPRSCLKQGTTNLPRKKVQMITNNTNKSEQSSGKQVWRTTLVDNPHVRKLVSFPSSLVMVPCMFEFPMSNTSFVWGGKRIDKWQGRKGVRRRRVGIMMMQVVSASRSSYMLHGNQ
jgi:hypothetical protein